MSWSSWTSCRDSADRSCREGQPAWTSYGASERALFESEAPRPLRGDRRRRRHRRPATRGSSRAARSAQAFELLLELGLLNRDPETDSYAAVDPSSVQSRVVSPLGQQGAQLLEESSQWAQAFGDAGPRLAALPADLGPRALHRHPRRGDRPVPRRPGRRREEEMLTAQPQTGRDPQTLAAAALRDTALLERGRARCARSTSTAPGAARSPTSTSPRSPPAAPRCAPSTSSSTG